MLTLHIRRFVLLFCFFYLSAFWRVENVERSGTFSTRHRKCKSEPHTQRGGGGAILDNLEWALALSFNFGGSNIICTF